MSAGPRRHRGDHEAFDELAVGWALHALEPEDEALFAAPPARLPAVRARPSPRPRR